MAALNQIHFSSTPEQEVTELMYNKEILDHLRRSQQPQWVLTPYNYLLIRYLQLVTYAASICISILSSPPHSISSQFKPYLILANPCS